MRETNSEAHKSLDECRLALEMSGNFRVLERVTGVPRVFEDDGSGTLAVAVVDIETTGLDPETDVIIELAIRRIRITRDGRIFFVGEARSWLEEAPSPLSPEVIRLTGLTDEDLKGQALDTRLASRVLCESDLIVAHNASFDRPFVERRLPDATCLPWACTCNDLDWASLGFEGRSLSHLLFQMGRFFDGHRGGADVDALIEMLSMQLSDGSRVFQHLLDAAERDTWLFEAVNAPYDARTALRKRGYRWIPNRRCWRREVGEADAPAEANWLAQEIYRGRPEFVSERLNSRTRHL